MEIPKGQISQHQQRQAGRNSMAPIRKGGERGSSNSPSRMKPATSTTAGLQQHPAAAAGGGGGLLPPSTTSIGGGGGSGHSIYFVKLENRPVTEEDIAQEVGKEVNIVEKTRMIKGEGISPKAELMPMWVREEKSRILLISVEGDRKK